ncbi:hypothetical protein AB1Y20_012001 [Prymnesium parvum]|uniref:Acyltransferase n=1 Tax=Prymnesium parvum TaxID=97485 RepID=A0AB34IM79_PRYPA
MEVTHAAQLDASPALLALTPLFVAPLVAVCLLLPSPAGPLAALATLSLALLPRLLWRSSQPAEGLAFTLANVLYWNLMYPAAFGSLPLLAAGSLLRPRLFLPPSLLYAAYAKLLSRPDLSHGAGWRFFSQHDWGIVALRRYLRLRLHVPAALRSRPPQRAVVIAIHPHGVASDYRLAMDGLLYAALPGREVLTLGASVLFSLPLVRELVLWTRCIDASKRVAARALAAGRSLQVIPGGEAEQMRTRTGVEEVYLARRAGFVKLAMQHGAALVPCYAFGATDLYDVSPAQHRRNAEGVLWSLSKRFGVALPLYRGAFGFVPKRRPVDLVFGEPFEPACKVAGNPTDEEVVAAHASYMAQLRTLFDTHKAALGHTIAFTVRSGGYARHCRRPPRSRAHFKTLNCR